MKRLYVIVLIMAICGTLLAGDYTQKTLSNGMEVITKKNDSNESVALYCFVKTGSSYEEDYLGCGISHYLEHIVSGGSTTLHTEDEYSQMEQEIGAYANAYTSSFTTCYQMVVPAESVDKGIEMLSEHIMFCAFDSVEVAREREVIIKEFVFRSSPPPVKAFEKYQELTHPQSTERYPVIGNIELYKQLKRDDLVNYYNKRYMPNNMIFVGVGNIDADTLQAKIVDAFKDYKRRVLEPVNVIKQPPFQGNTLQVHEFSIQQAQGKICTIIPDAWYNDCEALDLGLTILLSKRTSPLYKKLVEDLQLCNQIYGRASYDLLQTATVDIQFEAKDPSKMNEIVEIIDQYIADYSKGGFTQDDIQNVIDRYQAAYLLQTPSPAREANQIGYFMQFYNVPDRMKLSIEQISKLTPEDIYEAFQRHLVPKNRIVYYAMPTGTKQLIEEQEAESIDREDLRKISINDDLTLLYRRNCEKPLIRAEILMPIYRNYGVKGDLERIDFVSDMLLRGSKKYDPIEISEFVNDHWISAEFITSEAGLKIEMKLLRNDFDEFLKIVGDAMQNPKFPDDEIHLLLEDKKGDLLNSQSWPTSVHREFANKELYGDSPFSLSKEEQWDALKDLDHDKVATLYEKYFKTSDDKPVVVTLFGDLTEEEARKWAKEISKFIPRGTVNEERIWRNVADKDEIVTNVYDFEQVNIDIYYPAPSIYSEDYKVFRLLDIILSGSTNARLHKATRGNNNLSYWAYSNYDYSDEWGYFDLKSQTSIPKRDELISVLKDEVEKLKTDLVPQDEIDNAISDFDKRMQSMLSDNALPSYATYYEFRGFGYDYLHTFIDDLRTITPEQIRDTAKKYLNNAFVIVSQPDENMEREHQ